MIVTKSSVFPASRDAVFEKLQKPETLQYIAKPFAAFEPVGTAEPLWTAGSTSAYRFRLFGVILLAYTGSISSVSIRRVSAAVKETNMFRSGITTLP